jgi:hypothetical protein
LHQSAHSNAHSAELVGKWTHQIHEHA